MSEGYKITELGEIPLDWDVELLHNLGVFTKGKGLSKKELVNEGIPCVRYGEIYTVHDTIIRKYYSFIDRSLTESSVRLKKNDILFAGSGETAEEIGKAVAYISDDEVYAGGDIVILSPKNVNSIFLAYCLNNDVVTSQRKKFGQGNAVVHIYARDLGKLIIPVPPLPEQQKIAAILSKVDEKIDVIDAQITQTRELKKGLMQKLLTRGIGHTKFKDSVLGEIPESWEVQSIGKHIEFLSGYPFKSEDFSEVQSGIKLLRGINITVGNLRWNDKIDRYWDQEFSEYEKYSVKEGDLVISMDGSLVGRNYGRVRKVDLPLLLVQRVACLRAKSSLELEFLNQIIGSDIFINYVDSVKTSSGIPHISAKDINGFKIAFPPFDEQQKIADILSISDKKIDILKSKKETYQQLKKGLMQQLLTGKVRVVQPELQNA